MSAEAGMPPTTAQASDLMQAHVQDESTFPVWHLFTAFMLMGMQLAWIVPLYQLFTRLTAPVSIHQSYFIFGGVMLGAHLLHLTLLSLKLRAAPTRFVLVLFAAAAILLSVKLLVFRYIPMTFDNLFTRTLETVPDISGLVRPELLVALTVVLVWQRGMALAVEPLGPKRVMRHFQAGVGALLLFALLASAEADGAVFSLGLFILCGLLALAGARFSFLGQLRGGSPFAFQPVWVLGIIAAGALLLGISGVFGRAAGGSLTGVVAGALGGAWRALSNGFIKLTRPFVVLVARTWERILAWFQGMTGGTDANTFLLDDGLSNTTEELMDIMERPAWIDQAGAVVQTVAIGLIIVVAILVALRLVRHYRQQSANEMDEERESILGWGELGSILRQLLRRRGEEMRAATTRLTTRQQRRAAARVRQLYAELLILGQELDVSRPAACTPREYIPFLEGQLTGCRSELITLTDSYQRVRYGELPETSDDVARVERAWNRIAAVGEIRKREKRRLQHRVQVDNEDWRGIT